MRGITAILCIVVVAICGLGINGDAQLADYPPLSFNVKDYPTVSFNLINATLASYREFIRGLRTIVTRESNTTKSGVPVLRPPSKVSDKERFVLVHLTDYIKNTATVAIDVVNVYVVAFLVSGGSYFFKDSTTLERDNLFKGTKETNLTYTANYNDLETQARTRRTKIELGPAPLGYAIAGLGAKDEHTRAKSIIVVIQMVSEAVRFGYIAKRIGQSITAGEGFFPTDKILSMETSWSEISLQIQQSVDGVKLSQPVRLADDQGKPISFDNFPALYNYTLVSVLLDRSTAAQVDDIIPRKPVRFSNQLTNDARQVWTAGNANGPIVTYILAGMNMMCLQANNQYNALWLENCVPNRGEQKWALYSDGTIRVDRDRSLCVTSRSGVSRATIDILKCQGLVTQRWVFNNADLTILNPNSKLVMDVKESNVSLREIILFPPTGNPSQQWLTHTNPFG